jgi:DNA-binding response OmpR family regulator
MRKKILLVDDSMTALLMEQMILRTEGCELLTAKDGSEAVSVAEREKPDLILLDLVMPKMNGLEACAELRRREATKTTPIIMVTTRGEPFNVEAGYSSGCSDFVTKPIDGVELLSKVRSFLRG